MERPHNLYAPDTGETVKDAIQKNIGFAGYILGVNTDTSWGEGNLERAVEAENARTRESDRRIANGDKTEQLRRQILD